MSVGLHSVLVYPDPAGDPVDLSCYADEVSINHGRDDTDSQPEASSATVELLASAIPLGIDVGSKLVVNTLLGAETIARFTGRVTDVRYGWDDAGQDTPDRPNGQLVATGVLADLGRRVVGDTPYPQELDGARVSRVMAAAGLPLDPGASDPGTVQLTPRDIDSQPALDVAQQAAGDAMGVVWQTRAGEVRYADAMHRKGIPVALVIDACDVLVSPTWRKTTEGLVNQVSLGYGVSAGEQPTYTASADDSVARYGRYGLSASTQLAALADATALGQLLLTRNKTPVWVMSELPIDVAGLSAAQTHALLNLDMHSLVNLAGLPAVSDAPTSAVLWVEGWHERLAWGVHELALVVSGYCRTTPPPRWDDVPSAYTWDAMGAITWDQATCLGPLPSEGRWNDVSASQRWDQVPPATTWDSWKG